MSELCPPLLLEHHLHPSLLPSHTHASQIYFLPISPDYVAYVLEKERPDGVLLTFGGQSALNVGVKLDEMGVFERLGVKVLGSQVDVLRMCEDRDLFCKALDGELAQVQHRAS